MEDQTQETIGQKIKKWRTKRGLTQEGLARKADISYTTFVKIETEVVKNPSVETVKKIAQALEITIDELIS